MAKREVLEIFGLIGVIGSLVFVGVEVRQNTAEIRGSTHQSMEPIPNFPHDRQQQENRGGGSA